MSFTLSIDPSVNCAFIRLNEEFKFGVVEVAIEEIVNHSNYRKGMNVMRDSRTQPIPQDTPYKLLSDKLKHLMAGHDQMLGECKLALVLGDAQSYAKAHQFIVTGRLETSPVERKPFRDIKKAFAWLGIPEDYEIKYSQTAEAT
jgi:hypothetical protein